MASKQYSSQLWLSRIWHGIRHYERIRKNEEEVVCEEKDEISSGAAATARKVRHFFRHFFRKHEEKEVVCEETNEISSEAAATERKVRRLFKLSRRKPRTNRSRRRVKIRFVLGTGRRLRRSTLLSQLKVSWRRFAKLVKESQPHFADLLAGNQLFLHLTPPPPIYWYNHLERGGCRNIYGLSSGHPQYMLYML